MGVCLIPNDKDVPCGRQIEEGEPIGTVILNRTPLIGHRACAHGFHSRTQAVEREKRVASMKIGKQSGPGGSIGDPDKYPDALAFGSKPLVPEEKEPVPPADPDIPPPGVAHSSSEGQLGAVVAAVPTPTMSTHERDLLSAYRQGGITAALEYERQQEAQDAEPHVIEVDLTAVPPGQIIHLRLKR
jgi:hypothetical protein